MADALVDAVDAHLNSMQRQAPQATGIMRSHCARLPPSPATDHRNLTRVTHPSAHTRPTG